MYNLIAIASLQDRLRQLCEIDRMPALRTSKEMRVLDKQLLAGPIAHLLLLHVVVEDPLTAVAVVDLAHLHQLHHAEVEDNLNETP